LTESSKGIQMVSFPAVCLRKPAASEPTQYWICDMLSQYM
jgi:hypothetical protein